jgi:hypothetical protein
LNKFHASKKDPFNNRQHNDQKKKDKRTNNDLQNTTLLRKGKQFLFH